MFAGGPSKSVSSEELLHNYLARLQEIHDLNETENTYFIVLKVIVLRWEAHEPLCVDRCCKICKNMLLVCATGHFINRQDPSA